MKHITTLLATLGVLSVFAQDTYQRVIIPPGNPEYAQFRFSSVAPDGRVAQLHTALPNGFLLTLFDDSLQHIWSKKIQPAGNNNSFGVMSMAWAANGDLLLHGVVGYLNGSNYGFMRIDPLGNVLWTKMYHSDISWLNVYGGGIVSASMAGQLLAQLEAGHAVLSLDDMGEMQWTYKLAYQDGLPLVSYKAMKTSGSGSVTMAGSGSYWPYPVTVVRLAADGSQIWSKNYPGIEANSEPGLDLLADGGCIVTGSATNDLPWAMRLNSAGDVIWMKYYDEFTVQWAGFNQAHELPGGDILLFPKGFLSYSSSPFLALRIEADGTPINYATLPPDYLMSNMSMVGVSNEMLHFSADVLVPVDGGYLPAVRVLMRLDETLMPPCGGAIAPATSTDIIPPGPPVDLPLGTTEPVNSWSFAYAISDATFTSFDLCAYVLGEKERFKAASPLLVHPSPALSGQPVIIEHPVATAIECLSSDGRLVQRVRMANNTSRSSLPTEALVPGVYLLRALDEDGRMLTSSRLVIQ